MTPQNIKALKFAWSVLVQGDINYRAFHYSAGQLCS